MNQTSFTLLLLIGIAASCTQPDKTVSTNEKDTRFQQLADQYLEGYLNARPETGTYLGMHQYDGKASDMSKSALDAELQRLKEFESTVSDMDPDSLGNQARFDYQILLSAIQQEIFSFETMKVYSNNPMTYAGALDLNIYIQRDFASLEDRVRSVIAIEQTAPALFAAAKENLADSLPRPYVETAILIADGTADFLANDFITAIKEMKNDTLMKRFTTANTRAIEELKGFSKWLAKEKMPKTHNRYAIGKENYARMLLYNEMLTADPAEILATGLAKLKEEQALFAEVARKIDPSKSAHDVFDDLKKDHPTADNLIPEAKNNLEAIRQFLIDKKIISIPSEVRVEIEETPQYARSTSTASMDTPGPFETKATQAYYYITPVEKSWPKKQQEEWLTQFNYYVTDVISIHEAYPGHYVQFLHVNASNATRLEKIFGSYAFVEGWAHYTEQMMIEEGFGAGDEIKAAKYHLAQLDESLLRYCRLVVAIKTHCEGMNLADATKFFQENCYYEYKPAYQEALRGTFDPGYLSYTLGKLQILELREDYRKQEGENYSLQKFHDTLLGHGMAPVNLIRKIMIKDTVVSQ